MNTRGHTKADINFRVNKRISYHYDGWAPLKNETQSKWVQSLELSEIQDGLGKSSADVLWFVEKSKIEHDESVWALKEW